MASMVQKFLAAAAGVHAFRTLYVAYPADDPTIDLKPTSHEIHEFKTNLVKGVSDYYANNVKKYLSSINQGISAAVIDARAVHQRCPHSLLILAGYSQGAMVMHQAELRLRAAGDSRVLGQIAGTLLLGDGDRVPDTQAREFGTSSSKSEGIRTWVLSVLSEGVDQGRDVVDPATTANICNAGDVVCATSLKVLVNTFKTNSGIRVHTSYVKADDQGSYRHVDPALTSGADWVAQLAAGRILRSRWSAKAAPMPANAAARPGVYISSLACYSVSWCAAAGSYVDPGGETLGLLLTRSGTAWSASEAPMPAGSGTPNVNLFSVACPSASSCVAVGVYQRTSGGLIDSAGGLIETWSAHRWRAAIAPLPPSAPGDQSRDGSLSSVACHSASACVADGAYAEYDPSTGEALGRGMVLTDSDGRWSAVQPPLPASGEAGSANFDANSPTTVACPSATWCTAAGTYYDNTAGSGQGLLLTWSGGVWAAVKAPAPSGNTGVQPSGVACTAVTSCTVIGSYDNSAGFTRGLIDTGAGSAWTATKVNAGLFSVACPTRSLCAIGANSQVFTGSGTTWRATAAPAPIEGDLLNSVACPAAGPCAITAQSADTSGLQIMAGGAVSWTGFTVQPTGPINDAIFNAIACPTASTCIAAGFAGDGQGVVATGPS